MWLFKKEYCKKHPDVVLVKHGIIKRCSACFDEACDKVIKEERERKIRLYADAFKLALREVIMENRLN